MMYAQSSNDVGPSLSLSQHHQIRHYLLYHVNVFSFPLSFPPQPTLPSLSQTLISSPEHCRRPPPLHEDDVRLRRAVHQRGQRLLRRQRDLQTFPSGTGHRPPSRRRQSFRPVSSLRLDTWDIDIKGTISCSIRHIVISRRPSFTPHAVLATAPANLSVSNPNAFLPC